MHLTTNTAEDCCRRGVHLGSLTLQSSCVLVVGCSMHQDFAWQYCRCYLHPTRLRTGIGFISSHCLFRAFGCAADYVQQLEQASTSCQSSCVLMLVLDPPLTLLRRVRFFTFTNTAESSTVAVGRIARGLMRLGKKRGRSPT